MAIAQFERTLISVNSTFDNYLRGEAQLTPSELNGYAIFNSEKCLNIIASYKMAIITKFRS